MELIFWPNMEKIELVCELVENRNREKILIKVCSVRVCFGLQVVFDLLKAKTIH